MERRGKQKTFIYEQSLCMCMCVYGRGILLMLLIKKAFWHFTFSLLATFVAVGHWEICENDIYFWPSQKSTTKKINCGANG